MYSGDVDSGSLLMRAALSHLELAVANLASQSQSLQRQYCTTINDAIARLQACGKQDGGSQSNAVMTFSVRDDLKEQEPVGDDTEPIVISATDAHLSNKPVGSTSSAESQINKRKQNSDVKLHDWLRRLLDFFNQLDSEETGAIELTKWIRALTSMGISTADAERVFRLIDASADGHIDRTKWLHMLETVQEGTCAKPIEQFCNVLADLQTHGGRIYMKPLSPSHHCVIRPDSDIRIAWDFFILVVLIYIALITPYNLGFEIEDQRVINIIEDAIDVIFMIDILLNFRTGFYAKDLLCLDAKRIAWKYLRTWFFVDFVTCVPWDKISRNVLPDLQPARVLKMIKIYRVVKLIRLGRLRILLSDSEFLDAIEDHLSSFHQSLLRILILLVCLLITCHWLACCMPLSGNWYVFGDRRLNYVTAMYWGMMTLTTVGYGDVAPDGDSERLFASGAMMIGGIFYGCMIGRISAAIAARDGATSADTERMRMVRAWLAYHSEFPKSLKRRIKRHFQKQLQKTAGDNDILMIKELPLSLQHDVSFFVLHEDVRCNLLFYNLPTGALEHVMSVLERKEFEQAEVLVTCGDAGEGMYILTSGSVVLERMCLDSDGTLSDKDAANMDEVRREFLAGDSFGEEVLLGFEEMYNYTITACTATKALYISKEAFVEKFNLMPEIMNRIHSNFLSKNKAHKKSAATDGSSSSLPRDNAVLDAIGRIHGQVLQSDGRLARLEELYWRHGHHTHTTI
jgi:CRP-like cAMP-binding protein